jgi:hypothetical protein
MVVQLNHTLVNVRDKQESAPFVAEILGLADPTPYGPFLVSGHLLEIITRPYGSGTDPT